MRHAVRGLIFRLVALSLAVAGLGVTGGLSAEATTQEAEASAFDFRFTSIEGAPLPLADYRGNVLLIVNTASFCGFTRQYGGLQDLWERYRERGLVVLGVPSNDFGDQEPGDETEIKAFCETNFGIGFPLTTKVKVTGEGAHPFYRWAVTQLGPSQQPQWNFHKYLVAPDGQLVKSFPSSVPPTDSAVTEAIEALLPVEAALRGR